MFCHWFHYVHHESLIYSFLVRDLWFRFSETAQVNGTGMLLVYSSMIFLGLTLWDIFVAGLTTGLRRFLTLSSLRMISNFSLAILNWIWSIFRISRNQCSVC